jgi:PAS domain S-box-containing protein
MKTSLFHEGGAGPSPGGSIDLAEERWTRFLSGAFLLLATPFFVFFACLHLYAGETVRGSLTAFLGVGMSSLFLWLRVSRHPKRVYRVALALFGAFSVYLVVVSCVLGNTDRFFFLLLFPLLAFFTLGKREGLLWALVLFGLWFSVLLVVCPRFGMHDPPTSFLIRFVVTFLAITSTTYLFESIREDYQQAMEAHASRLETEIEERERVAVVLNESEKRFRDLVELLPEIIFEMDLNGRVTFANQNAFEVSGYTHEDLASGFDALRLIAPEDRERAKLNIQRRLNGEGVDSTEYTALRKNGERYPVAVRATPIIREGVPVGMRGILVDLTEQKRVERALKEEKEFSDSAINALPGVFYVVNEEGNLSFWNRHLERTSGYSAEEIAGMRLADLFVEEERGKVFEGIEKGFSEGYLDFETRHLTQDGREIPYHCRGARADIGGAPLLLGLAIDITDRRRPCPDRRTRLAKAGAGRSLGAPAPVGGASATG